MPGIKDLLAGVGKNALEWLLPLVEPIVKQTFNALFASFKASAETEFRTFLVSVYPTVDVHIEKLVQKTDTKLDDMPVKVVKEVFEEWAEKLELTLPNLDSD